MNNSKSITFFSRYSAAHGRNRFSFFSRVGSTTSFCVSSSTIISHKPPRTLLLKDQEQQQQKNTIYPFGLNSVTARRAITFQYPSTRQTTVLFSSSSTSSDNSTTNTGEDDVSHEETNNMLSEESYYNDISSMKDLKEKSLNHLQHVLYRRPEDICQVGVNGDDDESTSDKQMWRPRMAKDINYTKAVQTAWMDELKQTSSNSKDVHCCPIRYYSSDDVTSSTQTPTSLYGHLIWNEGTAKALMEQTTTDDDIDQQEMEYIVLFHTGAGTQDLFLHWKAHSLCLRNCVVFIADLLGDPNGIMGWNTDRTSYAKARDTLLQPNGDKTQQPLRPILQQRIQAAFDVFHKTFSSSKPKKFNVMGWCFGGHPVLEIMLSPHLRQQVKSATTFHGVIDGIQNLVVVDESSSSTNTINNYDNDVTTTTDKEPLQQQQKIKLLICHGRNDPFISKHDLELYQQYLDSSSNKIQWSILEFGSGVRHGFTNPAQNFHPNQQAFQYNAHAANLSWNAALTNLFS